MFDDSPQAVHGGRTSADVHALPEGCRVEVLDGTPIVKPRPMPIHRRVVRRLAARVEARLPQLWQLETGIDVVLAEDPLVYMSPDIVVFGVGTPLDTGPIHGEAVLLAIDVLLKGRRRDEHESKRTAYAAAGVPHYWRVEVDLRALD
ncbi:Uma2 family endonuclease [Umezawaea sp. Da 62-37]|uniref:Uma2 family endonuclease n=1 Tax=Umezawaea sp. Da 62-37 TaxID=3075927 RepID=UPI0028F747E1|nr:Uma2 family endonuclease [Umezawaea sp. Da 62-37]WNV89772.1 Uma2 family endonuclease [Umezawaea sp. Da 62-37]